MIFILLCLVSFLAAIYPFVIYPRILERMSKMPLSTPTPGVELSFSLLFCAYNEEANLPLKIANLRALKAKHPQLQILAYSDMSSDRTLEILQDNDDIMTVVPAVERLGKAWGMRQLVQKATGDILIFNDANVTLDEEVIDRLRSYFSDPEIGVVAGHLRYTNEGDSSTATVGNTYWTLEERIKELESLTGSTMGADGALFARRRQNYPEVPPHLLDDLTASISPLFQGLRVISAPDVIAYERLTTESSDEFRRKRRIACRAFNTHRHLVPSLRKMTRLNRFKYFSHKMLRWMSPFFLLLTAIFGILAGFAILGGVMIVLIVIGVLAAAYLLRSGSSKALKIKEIVLAFTATGVGIVESFQGKTYQIWSPAQSRDGVEAVSNS